MLGTPRTRLANGADIDRPRPVRAPGTPGPPAGWPRLRSRTGRGSTLARSAPGTGRPRSGPVRFPGRDGGNGRAHGHLSDRSARNQELNDMTPREPVPGRGCRHATAPPVPARPDFVQRPSRGLDITVLSLHPGRCLVVDVVEVRWLGGGLREPGGVVEDHVLDAEQVSRALRQDTHATAGGASPSASPSRARPAPRGGRTGRSRVVRAGGRDAR